MHWARRAASRAACTAGSSRAINTAMIAMTTRSTIKVNPRDRRHPLRLSLDSSTVASSKKPRMNAKYTGAFADPPRLDLTELIDACDGGRVEPGAARQTAAIVAALQHAVNI